MHSIKVTQLELSRQLLDFPVHEMEPRQERRDGKTLFSLYALIVFLETSIPRLKRYLNRS